MKVVSICVPLDHDVVLARVTHSVVFTWEQGCDLKVNWPTGLAPQVRGSNSEDLAKSPLLPQQGNLISYMVPGFQERKAEPSRSPKA